MTWNDVLTEALLSAWFLILCVGVAFLAGHLLHPPRRPTRTPRKP